MRAALASALLVAGGYLAILAGAYVFQRSLLYFPDGMRYEPQQVGAQGFSEVAVQSGDLRLLGWWRPPTEQSLPVILHFHGNGGSFVGMRSIYAIMVRDGAGVLGAGYPGYSGNPGSPTEAGIYASAQAHYDWLVGQGIDPRRIVIAGQSLGTGPAVWLASRNRAAGLILESPYTSMADMAQLRFPFLPARALIKDRYLNIERIGDVTMPVAWAHGARDTVVPPQMGQELFDMAREPKCGLLVEQAGHNDMWGNGLGDFVGRTASAMVRGEGCG